MPRSSIEIRQNLASHYYLVLSTPKHPAIFTSQAYKTREAALAGVSALRSSVGFNNRYQRLVSPRMELYFAVWAHSGEVLGTSAMFASDRDREAAIRAMKRNTPGADLIDAAISYPKVETP